MIVKTYSTAEAAEAVGISRQTLQAWIEEGKCRAPKLQAVGKVRVRVWAKRDVDRLRAVKEKTYWHKAKRPPRNTGGRTRV